MYNPLSHHSISPLSAGVDQCIIACACCNQCQVVYSYQGGYHLAAYHQRKARERTWNRPAEYEHCTSHKDTCPLVTGMVVHIRNHFICVSHPDLEHSSFSTALDDNLTLWCGPDTETWEIVSQGGGLVAHCEVETVRGPPGFFMYNCSPVVIGGTVYAVLRSKTAQGDRRLFALSLDTYSWRETAQPSGTAILTDVPEKCILEGEIHFISWRQTAYSINHWIYSPETDTWREIVVEVKRCRIDPNCVCVIHDTIYMVGTISLCGTYTSEGGWVWVEKRERRPYPHHKLQSVVPLGRFIVAYDKDHTRKGSVECDVYDT
ncbi:hypothetical protein KIPB_014465, partial [Kipferlia bialata]|eukprot:g14465.t1